MMRILPLFVALTSTFLLPGTVYAAEKTGALTVKPVSAFSRPIATCRLSPDHTRVLLWRYHRQWVELWDVAKDKPLRTWKTEEKIVTAAFSEDAKRVMTYGVLIEDGEIQYRTRLWNVNRDKPLKTFKKKLYVRLINKDCTRCLSLDGAAADVAPIVSIALLWDISGADPKLLGKTVMHENDSVSYDDIEFTPDSLRFFAICGSTPTHTFWDVKKEKPLLRFPYWGDKPGEYLARHHGSDRYLSWRKSKGDRQPKLMLWTSKGRVRETNLDRKLSGGTFHPNGELFLTWAGIDGTIRLRDVKTLKSVRSYSAMKRIGGVVFHPDGRTFVTRHGHFYDRGETNAVQLWETKTGKLLRTFLTDKPVRAVFLHPRKPIVVTASPGTISFWQPDRPKPLQVIPCRNFPRVCFVAGGTRLLIEPPSGPPSLYELQWK